MRNYFYVGKERMEKFNRNPLVPEANKVIFFIVYFLRKTYGNI